MSMANHDDNLGTATLIIHELRGPLTVIAEYADLLLNGGPGLPEEVSASALAMIRDKTAEANVLIDGLMGSLHGGTVGSQGFETFDATEIVHRAVEQIKPRAQLAGARVAPVWLSDAAVMVHAVPAHVLCILSNLLHNALSYSEPPATVVVELRDPNITTAVEIAVHDHGYGIPAQYHEQIFERGCRLGDRPNGFGLGLALSRGLAERSGGRLRLESSTPGDGSVFVLTLPRSRRAKSDL